MPREEWGSYPSKRERLLGLLDGMDVFSHREVDLPNQIARVTQTIDQLPLPAASVFADEWVYLHSHSWMATRLRTPLDVFRDAGAAVVEYGRRVRDQFIEAVVPTGHIPAVITAPYFATRIVPKWLVIGGVRPQAAGASVLLSVVLLARR